MRKIKDKKIVRTLGPATRELRRGVCELGEVGPSGSRAEDRVKRGGTARRRFAESYEEDKLNPKLERRGRLARVLKMRRLSPKTKRLKGEFLQSVRDKERLRSEAYGKGWKGEY